MASTRTVAVIVGSLRKESFNRKIAKVMIDVAPANLRCAFLEIGELPLYNQDLETASPPAPWTSFRDKVKASDGILIVSPEYNRSIPGALKNAIDVGSRPVGHSAWKGKPMAVAGVTMGPLGAMAGVLAIRQAFTALAVPLLPAPELYIANAGTLFEEGKVNEKTHEFLHKAMESFAAWIERNAS